MKKIIEIYQAIQTKEKIDSKTGDTFVRVKCASNCDMYHTGFLEKLIGSLPEIEDNSRTEQIHIFAALKFAEKNQWEWSVDKISVGTNAKNDGYLIVKADIVDLKRECYKQGWLEAADWADRDDLGADVNSSAYITDRVKRIKD